MCLVKYYYYYCTNLSNNNNNKNFNKTTIAIITDSKMASSNEQQRQRRWPTGAQWMMSKSSSGNKIDLCGTQYVFFPQIFKRRMKWDYKIWVGLIWLVLGAKFWCPTCFRNQTPVIMLKLISPTPVWFPIPSLF